MKKLNDLDLKILRRLTNNARVPLRDVAEGENSSRSSVNQRLQRMIESGVITSLKYHVNPKKLGYNTCTFVGVRLERGSLYKEVAARLEGIPEITEATIRQGPIPCSLSSMQWIIMTSCVSSMVRSRRSLGWSLLRRLSHLMSASTEAFIYPPKCPSSGHYLPPFLFPN